MSVLDRIRSGEYVIAELENGNLTKAVPDFVATEKVLTLAAVGERMRNEATPKCIDCRLVDKEKYPYPVCYKSPGSEGMAIKVDWRKSAANCREFKRNV